MLQSSRHIVSTPLLITLAVLLCFLGGNAIAQEIAKKKFLQHGQVVGAKECVECHESEWEAWKTTQHHANIDLVKHYPERAAEIAENMGITAAEISRSGLCTQCHFTVQREGAAPARVIDGVSCESCHGGAIDWLEIHNRGDRRESDDTADARAKRVEESVAAGMLRPSDAHAIAENCVSCHIITDEKLVNVGGHPASSDDFDLVAWSEGEVRHNFFASKGASNEPTAQDRKRVLYVVGAALSVEYHLRGLARAKEKADYGNAMGRGSGSSRTKFNAIVEALGDAAPTELKAIHEAINVSGLLKYFNVEALEGGCRSGWGSDQDLCRRQ